MFTWIKKAAAFAHETWDKCLTVPDYNSRLVFLVNAMVIHVVVLWQTFSYLHSPTKYGNYPTILAVLLGGHGANALGRLFTKRVGEKQDSDYDKDDPAPVGADGDKG